MSVQTYIAPQRPFSPLFQFALSLVARESRWRRALVEQVSPRPHDVILEIGCGEGALSLLLAEAAPSAEIVAIDAPGRALARARSRAAALGLHVSFVQGAPQAALPINGRTLPTKVIVNLIGAERSAPAKREIIAAARACMREGAMLHVADAAAPRALPPLFAPSRNFGMSAGEPGAVLGAIRAAGFEAVEETARMPAVSGAAFLYRARAA